MFASIQAFFGYGWSSASSVINSNWLTSSKTESKDATDRNVHSRLVEEWLVNPDHILSVGLTSSETESKDTADRIVHSGLVAELIVNPDPILSAGLTSSETESKNAIDRSVYSGPVAEWLVNSDHILSAIFTATERQAAFPREIVNLVTEYLQNHEALKSLSMFGPADWKTTFNKKVEMIQPPPEMEAFLQKINPFTGKLNTESCLCVFIPSHYQDIPSISNTKEEQEFVNHSLIPLNPATMEELAKNPSNPENQSKFNEFLDLQNQDSMKKEIKEARKALLNLGTKKSYWAVITPEVIPHSRNKLYANQKDLINEKGAKEFWQVPSTREVIICAFAHYAKTGVRILNEDTGMLTRCVERIDGYPIVVGVNSSGLEVHTTGDFKYSHIGVVALRKFAS